MKLIHPPTTPARIICLALALIAVIVGPVSSRDGNPKAELARRGVRRLTAAGPVYDYVAHTRGNMQLAVANNGTFGTLGSVIQDPITGEAIQSCEYPKNSDLIYLWVAAMWIGAVVGRDTLVTCGNEDFYVTTEFWPDGYDAEDLAVPRGFKMRSIDINSPFYSPDATSEQDIICEYADTLDDPAIVASDVTDNRPHIPLGIKVVQRSLAWSYSYADDFILFDYQVENIGHNVLKDVYLGIYVDGDAWHTSRNSPEGWNDDIVGFYPTHPAPEGCGFIDTINVAWHADNDGDPENGVWNEKSIRGVVGARVVRTPAEKPSYSYNWWITNYSDATRDFGPRKAGTPEDPYRNFGARMGTPLGDRNKYYMLRHEEFDYDLMFTAIDHSMDGWLRPPEEAADYAWGFDTRYLLSFGPFDINPGQKLPVSFAWVGGNNFHTDPTAHDRLFNPYRPGAYYNYLNFDELATNARWAEWVYDNPGVDTDGDGYYGEARKCDSNKAATDSTWYKGDGVPDFAGAGPPPAPRMRIVPGHGRLTVRWNGFYSETTKDFFLDKVDFEGYRVYIGRDDRPGALSVIKSFDREDYNRYRFRQITPDSSVWALEEIPFSLDSLRALFGDPNFEPLDWTRTRPYLFDSSYYYFTAQDYNQSDLLSADGIRKVFPNEPFPGDDSTQWTDDQLVFDYDGQPLPKYYEYELTIDSLLPTVPYYVAVTSFDFGSPLAGLPALETNPTNNMSIEYPQWSADTVESKSLDVYVYPNPYRIDAGYRAQGFEGRGVLDRPDDRVRAVHFANLPHQCTIEIYTLDGDLVKRIDHNALPGDPQSAHDEWNLITRNAQAVVSGLYYWVVISEERTQIGKLAIIK